MPAGPAVPGEGLPLVHRVREPDGRRRDDRPDARARCRRLVARAGCRAGRAGWRSARSSARSPRRRSARSPSTRTCIPRSSSRTSCSRCGARRRRRRRARGARARSGPRRRSGPRAEARGHRDRRRLLRAARERNARDGGRAPLGRRERLPALAAPPGAAAPRHRGRRARLQPDVPDRLPVRPALGGSARATCSSPPGSPRSSSSRWRSATSSTGRTCRGGSCSSTSRSRRRSGRRRSRSSHSCGARLRPSGAVPRRLAKWLSSTSLAARRSSVRF